jgi:hypothetical protein
MGRFLSAMVLLSLCPATGWAQNLIIQERIGSGFQVGFGRFEFYPPNPNPYAGRTHGPSLYPGYGARRLEGRVLWMPGGVSPPGPQAIERFTVGRLGPPPVRVVPSAPVVPKRYPHASYIRSYHHGGYARRN